ncbi:Thrombospondin-type laminin G domain and EAR repeat-containing protein [Halotydeus destructor]|nr:Thrombospondin-type laminin G domain and EAR repeat-containing protein [Halotydeus destructor]
MRLLTCLCLILLSSFSCQNVHGKPDEVIQQLFNRLAEALKDHEVFKRSVDGDAENSTEHSMSPEMVKIISLAMDEVIEETLKSVEVANGLSDSDPSPTPEPGQSSTVPSRQRRSDLSNNYLDPKYKNGVQKLSEIRPAFATCARPIHMSTALFQGRLFGICISAPAGGIPVVTVGEMSLSSRWTALPPEMTRFKTPLMSAVFTDDDQHLRFMIADSSGSNIVVHSMDSSGNWRESDFDFKHPIAMNVWRMQSDTKADWHLAVSNYSSTTEMKSETVFYGWRTTYFDVYHSVTSYDVRDICPFNSGGRDYVVIVNHRASPTTFNVDSELFKFDIDRRHWIFVQAFRTTGALDCEVFQLGKGGDTEKFLAIANHVDLSMGKPNYRIDSVIYKFAGSRFVPFQSIKVNGATQIKSFKGFNESFALAVAHLDGVEMFQYNGWRFIKSEVQPTQSQKAFGRGVKSMTTAKMGEDRVLIISNPLANTDSNVIQLHFKEDTSFRDWHRTGLEWCNKMRTRISLAPLVDLERKLEGTFNKNQHEPIEIPGDLVIKSNVSISGLLSSPLIYDMESHHNYSHELPIKLQHIVDHLEELERNTSRIEKVLHGALKIDGPEQVITVPLEFNEVNFKCAKAANCLIGEVLTESVNTFEVTNLEKRIIRTDRDEMINRNVVFDRMVAENIIVNGHVNGIDTADIVTKSGNHAFLVPQTFVGPVTAFDVQVKGTVNGMAISPETVLLKSGEQTVNGHVIFHEKVTVDELKTGTVNNVSLDEILPYVVTTVGKHVIRGQKEFDTLIVNDLDMLKGSTIDGVDIVDLYNNLLWKHGDQMVTGRYSFTNISVKGDLIVGGLINGIELPGPYVVYVNKPATISAPITFAAPVHIDHMHVSESLNGIKRIDQGNSDWPEQLDLVAKSKVQTITGKKIFTNLHLGGHSTVLGHVNGIDLSQFAEVAVKRSDFNEFLGKWQINGSAVFHGKLIVEGTVNGVNLDDMYKNAVKLTDTVVNVPGGLHFLGDVTAPEIMCRTVNGFIPERDWLTVHGRQVINGSMTFLGGVHLKNDFTVTGNVNGIEPKILHDSMMKYGNQVVSGPKEIHGDLFVGDLRTPQINDVKIRRSSSAQL